MINLDLELEVVNNKIVELLQKRGELIEKIRIYSFELLISDDKEEVANKIVQTYNEIKEINLSVSANNSIQTIILNMEIDMQLERLEALL